MENRRIADGSEDLNWGEGPELDRECAQRLGALLLLPGQIGVEAAFQVKSSTATDNSVQQTDQLGTLFRKAVSWRFLVE